MGVLGYSTTAASNTTPYSGVGSIAEGVMAIKQINDALRQSCADIAQLYSDVVTGITTTGTSSAYVAATASGHASYSNQMALRLRFHVDCAGGATTINVNVLGTKALKVFDAAGVRDPVAGEIKANMVCDCVYVTALNAMVVTGQGAPAVSDFARTVLDDTTGPAMLTTLGIGGDIPAVEALPGTGIAVRTAADTWATRSVTSTDGSVTITNPDGVAGNINLSANTRVPLATKTASGSANLSFTEFNNAVYRLYEFEFENVKPATDSVTLLMRTSTNGGTAYDQGAADYAWGMNGTGSSGTQAAINNAATSIALTDPAALLGNAAGEYGATGRVTLYGAPNAVPAEVSGFIQYWRDDGAFFRYSVGGTRFAATDVDAVRFLMTSGNIASGKIRMFGIV